MYVEWKMASEGPSKESEEFISDEVWMSYFVLLH